MPVYNEVTGKSVGVVTGVQIRAVGAKLYKLTVVPSDIDFWVQLFDATSLPANGTQPVDERLAPKGGYADFDYGSVGKVFSTGIYAATSSTSRTLTASAQTATFNWTRV